LGILLLFLFVFRPLDVIQHLRARCIQRKTLSVVTKANTMADHKNQPNQNNQTAPNKGAPMTEQQKQAAEAERTSHAPGSAEKQPGAPGADADKK
jgi:hypothetical protein